MQHQEEENEGCKKKGKKDKENIRNGKNEENRYLPRPMMKRTSKFEVDAFVVGYEVNGQVPICGEHVSHATRYWTIAALYKKYPNHFTMASLSRHFGICERVFRGKYKRKINDHMEEYDNLSPSESIDNSRKSTIIKYGRTKDIRKYVKIKNNRN